MLLFLITLKCCFIALVCIRRVGYAVGMGLTAGLAMSSLVALAPGFQWPESPAMALLQALAGLLLALALTWPMRRRSRMA